MTLLVYPDWVDALHHDKGSEEKLQLLWFEPNQQQAVREQWLALWDQIPFDKHFHSLCRERIVRSTPLALGPSRFRRLSMTENNWVVLLDPDFPETPWISLSGMIPSLLWIRGATTMSALLEKLAPYLRSDRPGLLELPKTLRLYKSIALEDPSIVTRVVQEFEPWFDDACWQNAHTEDPWDSVQGKVNMVRLQIEKEEAERQHPGRFPTTGFRSLWSQSILLIQQLPFDAWVFELRYAPAQDADVLQGLEEAIGFKLPVDDLPVDIVASLLRDSHADPEKVEESCRNDDAAALAKLSLDLGEPTSFALLEYWLKQHLHNENMLRDLCNLALYHQFDSLLFEVALSLPPTSSLRSELEHMLRPQEGTP